MDKINNAVEVYARWNGIERKVLYSAFFYNEGTQKPEHLVGYISKTALYEDMKAAGATPAQIKEARAIGKRIKPYAYRR